MKLKLNTNTGKITGTPSASGTPVPSFSSSIPPLQTPAATPGGSLRHKIIFKKPGSNASTPAPTPAPDEAPPAKKTKGGRTTKPSAKVVESRKRTKDNSDSENDSTIVAQPQRPPTKKPKFSGGGSSRTPKTPNIILKTKPRAKRDLRRPGDGYDSEASDQEKDPAIEEGWILRMMPGEDCDYLQKAITEKKLGKAGGADVKMRFFDNSGRRCCITVQGRPYAATMVDLPCIIEGMKSWDRRGFFKSSDICQMMLVFARIEHEDDAKHIELPKAIDPKTSQYPHGITAPMYNARKQRFRKRIGQQAIERIEEEVEALLAADKEAVSSEFVLVDRADSQRARSAFTDRETTAEEYADGEEDAEGEVDNGPYFGSTHHGNGEVQSVDANEDELADLAAAFEEEMGSVAATPMSTHEATPTDVVQVKVEEDSGDESIEGDGDVDDEDGEEEVDEEERARLAQIQGTREDIADFEKQIASIQAQLAAQQNPILKKRLGDNMKKLNEELQLKKALLGEDDE
jgi:transcription initiation factor TFIID subunit 7